MIAKTQTAVSRDAAKKKITVVREFDAPLHQVWKAWTDRSLLDKWWAPKPFRAETKHLDFREGGKWLYAMIGPDGEHIWCRADYTKVSPNKSFEGTDAFCDEQGTVDTSMPGMHWQVEFVEQANITKVTVIISFSSEEDMKRIVEMGFEVGFTAALGNLDELLAQENIV